MSPLLKRVMRDDCTEDDHLALLAECAGRTVAIVESDVTGERQFSLVHPDHDGLPIDEVYTLDSSPTAAGALVLCRRYGFKPGQIHRMEDSR